MREPNRRPPRQLSMRAALVTLLGLVVWWEAGVSMAQAPVTMEATAGLGGYVSASEPLAVAVTVTAEVLFVGDIELASSGTVIRVPIEVPAGTTKTFDLTAPPYTGEVVRVRLYAEGVEKSVASATLQLRLPGEDLVVGVVDGDRDTIDLLEKLTTTIGDVPVDAVELDEIGTLLGPLEYLVADVDQVSPELGRWIQEGGRLISETRPGGLEPETVVTLEGGEWFKVGEGEVLVVSDLNRVDWGSVLRPVAYRGSLDPWATPQRALGQAAASSGSRNATQLPWLAGAMIGYAVLVGPVNMLVLRRFRRRELAWVTIPAISLIAVSGFWLAGRQRLDSTETLHASMMIATETGVRRESVVVAAAGRAGRHILGFGETDAIYPTALQFLGPETSHVSGRIDGSEAIFDLPQLAYGAVYVTGEGSPLPSVRVEGTELVVDNHTDLEIWSWGVGGLNLFPSSGNRALAPGNSAKVAIPRAAVGGGFFNIADQVMEQGQMWNVPGAWETLYPLGEALSYRLPEEELYFFGFVQDYPLRVLLDGQARTANGPAVLVVPVRGASPGRGAVVGRLVSVGPNGFVEGGGPGYLYVNSDQMVMTFSVPELTENPRLRFGNEFGPPPPVVEAWDWGSSGYVTVEIGGEIDVSRFVSPIGEVVIRAGQGEDAQFGQVGMSPYSFSLAWEES